MISIAIRNIVKGSLLGLSFIILCSSCTLSKPSTTVIVDDSALIQPENKEQETDIMNSMILTEKNGIIVTTPITEKSDLLREITVDKRGEKQNTFLWEAVVDTSRAPLIDEVDVNSDGIKEIVIHINTGSGTGVAVNNIHVLNPDTLEEMIVEDPVSKLNGDLKSSVTHRSGKTYINTELNGKHLSRVYDYEGGSWGDQVGFGSIIYYEIVDGHLIASLSGQASMSEFPVRIVAEYDSDLTIVNSTLFYNSFLQPPLNEIDLKYILERWLPEGDWVLGQVDNLFSAKYSSMNNESKEMMINPLTGTVFDKASGRPIKSLTNEDALELLKITNEEEYKIELSRLAENILSAAGLKPASKEWITGFLDDGYLVGEVIRSDSHITIKVDVFTGQWEEIDPH